MSKAQITAALALLTLFLLAAMPSWALDLSTFQPQPPSECVSPEAREALAEQMGFVIIEKDEDLGATVWTHESGLTLLDVEIDGLSCIIGFKQVETEDV
ncbi:hypothetical protein ParaMal1_00025 [Paracoccus phage ParMal1]|uniref:Uncharacterized protein n=1 Tax=Paracoccus phage ParMal1 TaxID=3032416 RepID=A0AAF0FNT3_9CAUD|nr:hypothetical protein ParaMal1_00025 [Paracoccus phage ParMal1]